MEQLLDNKLNETREEREKRKQERFMSDTRLLLSTKEGRRWLVAIIGQCKTLRENLSIDSNIAFIEKGQRSIGLWVLTTILEAKPEAYTQMLQETAAEEQIEKTLDDKLIKESA